MKKTERISNHQIAQLLRQVSASYTILNENYFKIIAYDKAADAIEHLNVELSDLWEKDKEEKIPGIGQNIAAYITELISTGKVKHFEETFKKMPAGMFYLLNLKKIGAKTAYKLAKYLEDKGKVGKKDSEEIVFKKLEEEIRNGNIDKLEGFGKKKNSEILSSISQYLKDRTKEKRFFLSTASEVAEQIITYLHKSGLGEKIEALGSLRRRVATIGDIDLVAATNNPEKLINYFCQYPHKVKVIEKGEQGATIELANGLRADLRVTEPNRYGSMLQYFTGSKQHNITLREFALKKGLSLSEYGIKELVKGINHTFKTEKEFYNFLGLEYIPPEIRENTGEIIAAKKGKLPPLVELSNIKGDLHIHSNYDLKPSHDLGTSTLEELIKEADELGYDYIGISDHNPKQSELSQIEITRILEKRKKHFDQKMSSNKSVQLKKVFIMLEIDIKPDGTLAIPVEGLNHIDTAIISVHSSFDMDKEQMTNRILKALSYDKVKILGHPTTRIIGKRGSIQADWEKIFQFCKTKNIAVEINAYPTRLDLPDILIRKAVEMGVKLVINTDSHQVSEMELMRYGVDNARRGWAQKSDIMNTLPVSKFEEWIKK